MFWATTIFQAVMIAVAFAAFPKTYAPVILLRQATQPRRDAGDSPYYSKHEQSMAARFISSILGQASTRPLRLLALNPVIQLTSVISAFEYGILHIVLATFAELCTGQYGQSVEMTGLY